MRYAEMDKKGGAMSELLPDKLTFVKNHTRSVLVGRGAIDNSGRILNLVQYRTIIEIEINEREKTLQKHTTVDGVVINRERVSELLSEIAFLNDAKTRTKNYDYFMEFPLEENAVSEHNMYGIKDLFRDVARSIFKRNHVR